MGLLNGILGNVEGSTSPGNQQQGQNPMMGLLSSLTGGNQEQSGNMLNVVMGLVQQMGGIGGVIEMFRQHGMTQQADSWLGIGPNAEISGDDVQNVFGPQQIESAASQLGISSEQTSSGIARILPELINQLTPDGHVPENQSDLMSQAKSMLGSFLH